jgi:hypothetical protein
MSTTPTIRPLKAADIPTVLVDLSGGTLRGYVAELDGEIVGVMGVHHAQNAPIAFSQIGSKLRKYPKLIVKAMRMFRELLEANYVCVYAAASWDEPSTFRTLEHVGFRPHTKGSDDHRGLWVWQIQ